MYKPFIFTLIFCLSAAFVFSQPVVYKDASTLITGTWSGSGTLTEVTGETPHEGTKHYRFVYNYSAWWAGIGLNMDTWGTGSPKDFSGYSHLRIAYRGMGSGQTFMIQLRNENDFGNQVEIGTQQTNYTVVDIPMLALTAGSNVSASAVTEIDLSISSTAQSGSGTVYFDAIELVNVSGGPTPASAQTMARAASLGLGLNTSNWLEAWWLLPYNAYPEYNKYTRTMVRNLVNAGFSTIRLPVIFERLGATTSPYELDFNHEAFELVDSMILWANIYGFKLIIDNHHGYPLTNSNYNAELPRLTAVWQQLTQHYDYLDPEQFFFEIYNEPTTDISNANFRTVAVSLVNAIRANETQTHSVFVGANSWNGGTALTAFTPLDDPDIIYTFHNYDPYLFTHQGMSWTTPPNFPPRTFPQSGEVAAIQQVFSGVKTWADFYAVPANLGEFGCSTAADATSRCNWIETMTGAINTNGFSHFYWDAITPSDAFGFYTGGVINSANCIPCFKTALGLYAAAPIAISAFSADCINGAVEISWTAFSAGGGYFELEGSNDATNWQKITETAALDGEQNYTYLPQEKLSFYRLHWIDSQGVAGYSPIASTDCAHDGVGLSPNPARYFAGISVSDIAFSLSEVGLYDLAGRRIWGENFASGERVRSVSIPVYQFPAGTYMVSGSLDDGTRWYKKLVIVK